MERDYLRIKTNAGNFDRVNVEDVIRIKAEGNYVKVFATDERHYLFLPPFLEYYHTLWTKPELCAVSRFYVVNINHIVSEMIADRQLLMSDKELIKVTTIWDKCPRKESNVINGVDPTALFLFT